MLGHNGLHIPAFPVTRGTTQGGLVSPMILNMVADNIIRTWMAVTVEDERVDNDGLGETARRCLGVFWHGGITRPGLAATLDKRPGRHLPKVWLCGQRRQVTYNDVPTWNTAVGVSEEANAMKCTKVGDSYRVIPRRRIPCLECGVEITVGSMTAHRQCMHSTETAIN